MIKKVKGLLIVQFLIVAVYLAYVFLSGSSGSGRLDIPLDKWYSNYAEFREDHWFIPSDNGLNRSVTFLHGPVVEVEKGDYTATICYEADSDQSCQPYVYKTNKGVLL